MHRQYRAARFIFPYAAKAFARTASLAASSEYPSAPISSANSFVIGAPPTMIDAMAVVGERFKNGEIFVPEMMVAARAMKKGVEVLKPHLASGATGSMGKLIIATVAGDLHDIGKNLVR